MSEVIVEVYAERLNRLRAVAEAAKALCACAVESEWSDAEQTGMGFLRAALAKLEEVEG